MSRLKIPSRDEAPVETHPTLDTLFKQLGFIPNLFLVVSQSANTLQGLTDLQKALAKTLDPKMRHRIALAVSQVNECDYCLAAHSYVGTHLHKLSTEEVSRNRDGHSDDPKSDAAVQFAKRVTETRGIVEIVATAVQFLFTNFINNVADTDIDFPTERA
jgi:AhpD family alkylhydroperoxidase